MYRICAIAKNEQPYLEEWLEHHLSIGFDDITVIEDYGSYSHEDVTSKFSNKSVHLIKAEDFFGSEYQDGDEGYLRQIRAYNKYIYDNRGTNDWVAFIDIDEYIALDENVSMDDIFAEIEHAGQNTLAMFWVCYNASYHVNRPASIQKSYTTIINTETTNNKRYGSGFFSLFKSFVKLTTTPDRFSGNCHEVSNLKNINGDRVYKTSYPEENMVVFDKIHIDHYFTKSWQDWCCRIKRDNMHSGLRQYEDFFILNPEMKILEGALMRTIQ